MPRRSREALWRGAVGDEAAEASTMAGREPVQRVDEPGGAKGAQHASEGAGEPDLGEERNASARIAGDRRAVAKDKPPTFVACFLRDRCEQTGCLLIGEREQGQLFASIERGDDPRRPAAKPSGAGIEQNWTQEARRRGGVLCHLARLCHEDLISSWITRARELQPV
jgi:hypothetical protein